MEVREEPDGIQDLSARAVGFLKGKETKSGRQVSEALANIGHEAGYLKVIYPEFFEVGERREAMHGTSCELFRVEFVITFQADPKSLDQRKEAKFVRFFEWPEPKVLLLALAVVVHVVG